MKICLKQRDNFRYFVPMRTKLDVGLDSARAVLTQTTTTNSDPEFRTKYSRVLASMTAMETVEMGRGVRGCE